MSDRYTLIIPTYNRSGALAAFLRYLESEQAAFPILLLDSSVGDHRERNRATIASVALRAQHVEFDDTIPLFDKFRAGIDRVETPYCALCADDDLVLVDGIGHCIDHLDRHPDVCVVHGYYFTFLQDGSGAPGMDLTGVLYYTPDIDSEDALSRLRQLFRNYQALTYGIYRTPVLRRIFEAVRPVQSLLARELLSSALSVVHGKAARLRCFTNGRSLGASGARTHWHPLEWLIDAPEEFFAEYVRYREILVAELMATPAYGRSPEISRRVLDLVHIFYLVRHIPLESHDFILDHVMSEIETPKFWPDKAIQEPLIRASAYLPPAHFPGPPAPLPAPADAGAEAGVWPRVVTTPLRQYRLHQAFMKPQPSDLITVTEQDVLGLITALDKYRPEEASIP